MNKLSEKEEHIDKEQQIKTEVNEEIKKLNTKLEELKIKYEQESKIYLMKKDIYNKEESDFYKKRVENIENLLSSLKKIEKEIEEVKKQKIENLYYENIEKLEDINKKLVIIKAETMIKLTDPQKKNMQIS